MQHEPKIATSHGDSRHFGESARDVHVRQRNPADYKVKTTVGERQRSAFSSDEVNGRRQLLSQRDCRLVRVEANREYAFVQITTQQRLSGAAPDIKYAPMPRFNTGYDPAFVVRICGNRQLQPVIL